MKFDFDLIVIGGGAAGLVAATGGASLGAKTLMIEKERLGGDCTWYGCIPSKSILASAHALSMIKRSKEFGIKKENDACDVSGVLAHVRSVVDEISKHHPAEVFEKRGIKVLFGSPNFVDRHTIDFEGESIRAKRFILAPGSKAFVPEIEGLEDVGYLTNENIFDMEQLPSSMIILGAGPIGVELAQAFSRLGVKITIVEMVDRILFREENETSAFITKKFKAEGIDVLTGKKAVKFSTSGAETLVSLIDKENNQTEIKGEKILVAVGRVPNISGLDLEKAGVKYGPKGIEVDRTLRTSAKNIYAAGDAAGPYQFSHMAEYQAIIAIGNAISPFKQKVNYSAVAWATFTDPEVARLGLTENEAREKHKGVKVYRSEYASNDRAVTDLEREGFVKVVCDKKGYILGTHIVGANAGEVIHEYVLAKNSGLKIGAISSAIHIYPTLAQVAKRAADGYYTEMLSTRWFKTLSKIMVKILR